MKNRRNSRNIIKSIYQTVLPLAAGTGIFAILSVSSAV